MEEETEKQREMAEETEKETEKEAEMAEEIEKEIDQTSPNFNR
jgi:hypothetical protein